MTEIWKDIKDYEGLYQVSNLGMVRSLDRVVKHYYGGTAIKKGKTLKQNICGSGYLCVALCKNGKRSFYRVHRLVAEAFIPNPDNLPQINHKSEVKTENFVENLEWCDNKYNSNYGTKTFRANVLNRKHKQPKKKREPAKKINQYSLEGVLLKTWKSARTIEKETGFDHSGILHCCNGIQKTSSGFKWSFAA